MAVIPNPAGPGFIDVPDDQAQAATPQGTPTPAGPTRMIDPKGKMFDVPASSYDVAIKNGWREATSQELEKEKKIDEGSNAPANEVFGKNFTNEVLFGVPDLHADLTATPEQRELQQAIRERELQKHPIAGYAGKALGFAVPMAIPGVGEVGEASRVAAEGAVRLAERSLVKEGLELGGKAAAQVADKSLATKVAGSVAKYATEGALYSTPQAMVQATYGDPEKAAETMLWSVGLSGALGGAGRLLGEGATAAVSKGAELAASKLEKYGHSRFANELEELLTKPSIKDLGPVPSNIGAEFHKELLTKAPEVITPMHEEQGKLVSDIMEKFSSDKPSFKATDQIKKELASMAKKQPEDSANKQILNLAEEALDKHYDTAVQQVFHAGEMPEKFADYLESKAKMAEPLEIPTAKDFIGAMGLGAIAHPHLAMLEAGRVLKNFAFKNFLNNKAGLLDSSVNYLKDVAANPSTSTMIGGLMAKEGAAAFQAKLDSIPSILTKDKVLTHSIAATNPIQHLIGSTNGLDKETQYNRTIQAIQSATIDTQRTADNIGHMSETFNTHSVDLGSLVAQKQYGALSYLASQIPKNPNAPKPFQKDDWKPSVKEQQDFLNKVKVVADPWSVMKHYQDGSLSKNDVQTLKAVYPKIYTEMVNKVLATAYDPTVKPLNQNQRLQLSTLTGLPLDSSLKNIVSLQQALQPIPAPPPPAQPKKAPKPSSRPKLENAASLETSSQRRTYR